MIGRAAVVATAMMAAACDSPCAFRIVTRLEVGGRAVACCGAADMQDVVVPDEPDVAIDLSQRAVPDRVGGQDLWLTGPDCGQLFDAPYVEPGTGPRPSPRCPVLLGPVAPGRISPRAALPPGRYRVFVQSYSTNPVANHYQFAVSVWATSCARSPVGP